MYKMSYITLITGGSRSGKSSFAQRLAEERQGSMLFLATCPVTDGEMELRILRHVRDRQKGNWETIEEPVHLADRLKEAVRYDTVLIDCLTLWINNLQYEAVQAQQGLDEEGVREQTERLLHAARAHPGEVIMVTNEVGLGIVPENSIARQYRDLVGRCNQCAALGADRVFLVCCGIPLQIKGKGNAIQKA
jgi:adenosylcobinamide kinase / adenosylcobinamide-phosphate guanylyltransferase